MYLMLRAILYYLHVNEQVKFLNSIIVTDSGSSLHVVVVQSTVESALLAHHGSITHADDSFGNYGTKI